MIATVVSWLLGRKLGETPLVVNLKQRVAAWWPMAGVIAVALALGETATVLLFLLVSLMAQYTPVPGLESCPEIDRRITTFEYNKVLEHLRQLDLPGFCQDRRAAKEEYTPPFDLTGV